MVARRAFVVSLVASFLLYPPAAVFPQADLPEGFVSLVPEAGLEGWVVMAGNPDQAAQAWHVEEGVLTCDGRYGGWLRTERTYKDFVLRLEYAVSRGGNSGIFLRATEQGNPAFTGMELQILDDYGRKPGKGSAMALYGSVAPAKNLSKKCDEWNSVEVTCQGSRLKVVWNGEQVMDVNLDDPDLPYQERPLAERAGEGYIGFQNHGSLVRFRNMAIKVLD